jgi:aminoglycoside phosphotransferase family enzyme/predicted kinase
MAVMIADSQQQSMNMLMDAASHGSPEPIERIETHISRIFLARDRAFKMKRAVRFPYVDFSTPELRLAACRKEVDLNSITAPGLYLGVRRIMRRPDGVLTFDGDGQLVDAVIEMVRFDQSKLLDSMAMGGALTPGLMTGIARMIVRFHRGAPVLHTMSGSANMSAVLDINEAGFDASGIFNATETAPFNAAFRAALTRHALLLDRREAAGKVRRCHGDLHLRNICMLDGEPRLFDCIEFNDQIATIDTLYDLAFLLMDLWHRGFPRLANLVANRYLDESGDEDGFVLLPFFMAVRAAVRAHVTAAQATTGSVNVEKTAAEARSYFDVACLMLQKHTARLIAIGGLSGSGKTTIAEALAAHVGAPPGARIVESDRIRKAMHGVAPETRLPEKAYRPEVSAKVYHEMAWRASLILSEGGSVVAEAVFDNAVNRELIEKAAREASASFVGVWLRTDPSILWQRVSARRESASDATIDILARQLQRKVDDIGWITLDAATEPAEIVARILRLGAARDDDEPSTKARLAN